MYFSTQEKLLGEQKKAILPSISSLLQIAQQEIHSKKVADTKNEVSVCNSNDDKVARYDTSQSEKAVDNEAYLDKKVVRKKTRSNLPKHVIDILNGWLEDHLDNPYPTSLEKKELIEKTSLSNVQLSNWFINVRRRKLYSQYYYLKNKKEMAEASNGGENAANINENAANINENDAKSIENAAEKVTEHATKNAAENVTGSCANGKVLASKLDSKITEYGNTYAKNSLSIIKNPQSTKHQLNHNKDPCFNDGDYLYTKKRMSLEHILNDFPAKPSPTISKASKPIFIRTNEKPKVRSRVQHSKETGSTFEPPKAVIITEANEIKLEEKFKFQPFIKRKKLMDRLYDLKKIYYMTDKEAGLEPMPEPDSDD